MVVRARLGMVSEHEDHAGACMMRAVDRVVLAPRAGVALGELLNRSSIDEEVDVCAGDAVARTSGNMFVSFLGYTGLMKTHDEETQLRLPDDSASVALRHAGRRRRTLRRGDRE